VGIYRTSDETQLAIETSRDILAFYPATPEAEQAKTYLASLSPETLAVNWELEGKMAVKEEAVPNTTPQTSEPSRTPAKSEKPKKKNKKQTEK
jgi:hypothetical protein